MILMENFIKIDIRCRNTNKYFIIIILFDKMIFDTILKIFF